MSRPPSLVAVLVLALGLVPLAIFAEGANHQKIRALDDPAWLDLAAVLLDAGRVQVSPTPPYSDARILMELEAVDPGRLSAAGRKSYDRLLAELAESLPRKSGALAAKIGLGATPAVEWRSTKDIPWILGYADRPDALTIPFEFAFADSLYGYSALALRADPNLVAAGPISFGGLNFAELATAPIGIDTTFPFRAFASVGGSWWNFQIGRDRLSMGNAGKWNMTISSDAELYDFGRLSLFAPGFAYSAIVAELNVDRYLYSHRFDFRLGGGLSLGLTESSLVGSAPLELRFLNPLMVFHGFEAWSDYQKQEIYYKEGSSNEIGIELNWSPRSWLAFSGQYAMNQISDPLKMLFWPTAVSEIPDGEGWLASLELRAPVEEAFFVVRATGAYTTPTFYISPWTTGGSALVPSGISSPISWIYDRPSKSNYGSQSPSLAWIGFSEGPDVILAALSAGLDSGSAWSLMGDIAWKARGEKNAYDATNNWDDSTSSDANNARLRTPSGTPEYDLVVGASATRALPSLASWLQGRLAGGVHWTGRWNADHLAGAWAQGWEVDASASFALR